MAYTPLVLVENLFSVRQFPDHTISGNEEPSGTEAFRVADGRRSALDYWSPTTTNAVAYTQVLCDRMRAANMLVLDRGHNVAGIVVTVTYSEDSFTTSTTAVTCTIPTVVGGGSPDDTNGVVTEEGAWLKRFATSNYPAASQWRFNVAAMGSGLKPQIVGLWLGLGLELPRPFDLPWSEDADEIVVQESMSDTGWTGAGPVTNRRSGTLGWRLETDAAYDQVRYHLAHFQRRRPMWIVPDLLQADRAVLAIRPAGSRVGMEFREDWWNLRRGEVPWVEHEPLV